MLEQQHPKWLDVLTKQTAPHITGKATFNMRQAPPGTPENIPAWAAVFEPQPYLVEGEPDDHPEWDDIHVAFHEVLKLFSKVHEFQFGSSLAMIRGVFQGQEAGVVVLWFPDCDTRPPRIRRMKDGSFKPLETLH